MSETKIYPENKVLCFTPEHKIEKWKQLIYKTASEGNIVKLYSDTESTGLVWTNKGRPTYDPQSDRKMLTKDAAVFNLPLFELEKEAKELSGKIDRLIEYAFVACYTDKQGDTHLLIDDEGDAVFLHEMIHPNKDTLVPESKRISKMPLVPYNVHKTSFDFLDGKEEHPFLGVKLPHPAPSTEAFFLHLIEWFRDYENDDIFDNIYMFFHNGDNFDVPFIDAELNRVTDGQTTLRDLVQTYDTLKIVKNIMPSDVQKYISKCQNEDFYGGDSSIKDNKEEFIQPTQKNLDNIVRLAKFLIKFDPDKPNQLHEKWQKNYAQKITAKLSEEGLEAWESLQDYLDNPDISKDFSTGATKVTSASPEIKKLVEGYKKFRSSRNDFDKQVVAMNKHEKVVKNLFNIKETINGSKSLRDALERLNSTDRSAHGARVDSQLFMDALIVIEGAFYPSPKLSLNPDRDISKKDKIELPVEAVEYAKKKAMPSPTGETHLKEALKKIDDKYNILDNEQKKNKTKLKR